MSHGEPKTGLSLAGTRELILPVTVLGSFVLYYVLELPGWTVVALALPMGVIFALAPSWAARSVASFDRDLVRLLASGQRAALRRRYALALGMRVFSPPAVSAERRAVVAAENGLAREAKAGYLVALDSYGKRAPLRVLLGYAHAATAWATTCTRSRPTASCSSTPVRCLVCGATSRMRSCAGASRGAKRSS
jgi:hypothetical protein